VVQIGVVVEAGRPDYRQLEVARLSPSPETRIQYGRWFCT
jgi:hypothetical protein